MIPRLRYALRSLWSRPAAEQQLDGELAFHLDQETRLNMRRGMTPDEARRAATLSFGAMPAVQEECREAWGTQLAENLWRDVKFGLRSLRKDRGFTVLAVLTLALGIGSNTALFTTLRSVVLRPLPVRDGDRVLALTATDSVTGRRKLRFSFPELRTFRERTQLLETIQELHTMTFTLLGRAEPQNVETGVVPADYFDALGVKPLYGRTFAKGEDHPGSSPVLVLNHRYFVSSFGANPAVVGTTVRMNDRVHTIVGVLPPMTEFPQPIDLYMPTSSCPTRGNPAFENNPRFQLLRLFARMKPGVTADQVRAEFDQIFSQYRADHKDVYNTPSDFHAEAIPLSEELSQNARPTLWLLFGVTTLVLLIACASVANLFLSRMLRRERELAIRAAIGGTRRRLLQQLMVEGLMVSLAAGALGLLMSVWALRLLTRYVERLSPRAVEIGMDWPVLAFCAAVSILTGLVFCALPAWRSRIDLVSAMKDGSAGATTGAARHRTRRLLVSAQVAFSFVVLVAAGLLLQSLLRLARVNLGFQPEHVITMRVNPNWSRVNDPNRYRLFYVTLLDRIRQTPGVISAAASGNVPLAQAFAQSSTIEFEGQSNEGPASTIPSASIAVVSPGYFETLRIPAIRGRFFAESDQPESMRVAIVDATMAKRRWPDQDPVGRRIRFGPQSAWATVVGVVGATRAESLDRDPAELVYLVNSQAGGGNDVVVRTAVEPGALMNELRRIVHDISPDQAIASMRTMEDVVTDRLAAPDLTARLVGLLAALTLLITVAGIGGVAALSTEHRRTEIGLRLAMGARPGGLVGMILKQELRMVFFGMIVGVAGGVALARLIGAYLFSTSATDPVTFSLVASLMLTAAAAACLIPAVRAARLDPARILRSE